MEYAPAHPSSCTRMQSESLDLIRRYYHALNNRAWENLMGLLSDGIVHDLNHGASETGRETFKASLERTLRCYRETLSGITIISSNDGNRAAAEYRIAGEYLATDAGRPPARGQKYVLDGGAFFQISGRQV